MFLFIFAALIQIASADPIVVIDTHANPQHMREVLPEKNFHIEPQDKDHYRFVKFGYLKPGPRDDLFRRLDFRLHVAKMDELAKDMLIRDAYHFEVKRLMTFYPNIPKRELQHLRTELNSMAKRKPAGAK